MLKDNDFLNEECSKDNLNLDNSNIIPRFEKEKIDIDNYLESNNNNFFVSASNIYPSVMKVVNWIMRHTYVIVVIYIGVLFFIKFVNQ